jgi:hypothetical protein
MRSFISRGERRGRVASIVFVVLVLLVIAVAALVVWRLERRQVTLSTPGEAAASRSPSSPGASPSPSADATGATTALFHGCPPDGDGGDRALNRLKNRSAPASLQDVAFDSVLSLPRPTGLTSSYRTRWPARVRAVVTPIERRAVRVEAYVARAVAQGPESTNCHGDAAADRDYHIWLTASPTTDRTRSVIAEMTPRLRAVHGGWDLPRLREVARRNERVRVGGWLMLDQEHPEQIGRTRGTTWEIHPVTSFEVQRGGRWVALDDIPLPRGRR